MSLIETYQKAAGFHTPKGYQKITSLSASTPLTVPAGARSAIMIPEGQAVRWLDGADPTAANGMPLPVGQPLRYSPVNLATFRVIEQAASATLHVFYYD